MRLFALSDIHADYDDNRRWVRNLSDADYRDDALICAGDLSHDRGIFTETMACLRKKFSRLFFVPGNHDLWIRKADAGDSLQKHRDILALCRDLGIDTGPGKITDAGSGGSAWIVPLDSWYAKPEESVESLFVPKEGEDPRLRMWVDDRATRWDLPEAETTVAAYFLGKNAGRLRQAYDAPVISFSHFLPRRELIFGTPAELAAAGIPLTDPMPRFNFSRVAGCSRLDTQIRRLGSVMHVYGHQHRNRHRTIDGVTYVSHCLGYPRERAEGRISGRLNGPRLIWDFSAASDTRGTAHASA